MTENSETKVANLLACMDNLLKSDFKAKFAVLIEIAEELQGQIALLVEAIEKQRRQIEDLEQAFFELPECFELKEKMLTVEEVES